MKLFEIAGDLSYLGFSLSQEEEREDDNIKIWHTITTPNGERAPLDHSPYEMITPEVFKLYVLFFKEHKRFPTRRNINSNGPIHNEDMEKLSR